MKLILARILNALLDPLVDRMVERLSDRLAARVAEHLTVPMVAKIPPDVDAKNIKDMLKKVSVLKVIDPND